MRPRGQGQGWEEGRGQGQMRMCGRSAMKTATRCGSARCVGLWGFVRITSTSIVVYPSSLPLLLTPPPYPSALLIFSLSISHLLSSFPLPHHITHHHQPTHPPTHPPTDLPPQAAAPPRHFLGVQRRATAQDPPPSLHARASPAAG